MTEVRAFHSVFAETDDEASDPGSVDLLCMLAFFIRPAVIVEAGTYRGHTALALANMCRVAGHGRIYTADVVDRFSVTCGGSAIDSIRPYVHFHVGEFLEMLASVPGSVDLGYIDASSLTNPHLRMEHAEAVYTRLSPGGLIVVDDTESPDWPDAKAFQRWAKSSGVHLSQRRGLTIIQKDR